MKIYRSYCEDYIYFTMDAVEFSEASLAKLRLSSFLRSPSQNNVDIHISNSPIKLAEAGFERPDDAISDEVFCKHCGLTFSGWEGEPPLATHRILRPNCPFLNPPSTPEQHQQDSVSHSESTTLSHSVSHNDHHTSLSLPSSDFLSSSFIQNMLSANINTSNSNVRRQLFSDANNSQSSSPKLFRPRHRLGFLALFESHRLLTFLNPFSCEAAIYAKCGFVFNCTSSRVMCVFCNVELEEIMSNISEIRVEMVHESKAPRCPFVCGVDLGNISRECERAVRDKVRNNSFCCSLDHNERCCGSREFVIKHPEFEEFTNRRGTFNSWPTLQSEEIPVDDMAECGFYCTGLMDSVRCYCCGVGLRNWSKGADPFLQHSRASPLCLHMLQLKGQDFINDAQGAELTVVVDYGEMTSTQDSDNESDAGSSVSSTCSSPSSTCSSSSFSSSASSCSSSIGSPHLNLDTIKAATCQYTIEQIADAVLKFFISSWGQYPNEQLLLGTLKAADENHKQICQQREEIISKETVIQETKSQLQAKDTQLQAKDTVIQETKSQLQAKDSVIQAKERELAQTRQNLQHQVRGELEQIIVQKDEIIVQNREIIVQKDEQLEQNREQLVHKDEIIEQKDEQLEEKDIQLYLKSMEVEDLKRHILSLRQELRRKETSHNCHDDPPVPVWSPPIDENTNTSPDGFPVARCTVCYSNPSQIVFQPCGHLCCCDQCASKLMNKKCPICREANTAIDKVYVM